jgi:TIR domain
MGLITVPHRTVSAASSHVFVSYARADLDYARRLIAYVRSAGVPAWTDDALDVGDRWVTTLQGRLDECAALVVVMSPTASESVWVEREIRHTETLGKPILPVLLAGTIFFRLAEMQYEDVTGGVLPSPGFVTKLRELVNANAAGIRSATDEPTPLLDKAVAFQFRQARTAAKALRSPLHRRAH